MLFFRSVQASDRITNAVGADVTMNIRLNTSCVKINTASVFSGVKPRRWRPSDVALAVSMNGDTLGTKAASSWGEDARP